MSDVHVLIQFSALFSASVFFSLLRQANALPVSAGACSGFVQNPRQSLEPLCLCL